MKYLLVLFTLFGFAFADEFADCDVYAVELATLSKIPHETIGAGVAKTLDDISPAVQELARGMTVVRKQQFELPGLSGIQLITAENELFVMIVENKTTNILVCKFQLHPKPAATGVSS